MDLKNNYLRYKLKYSLLQKIQKNMIGGRKVVPGACSLLYSCKNKGGRCYYMSVVTLLNNVKHRIDHKEGLESVIEFVNKNMDCFGEVNTETEGVCKMLPFGVGREINKMYQELYKNENQQSSFIQEGGDPGTLLEAFLRKSIYYDNSDDYKLYEYTIFKIPPEGISSNDMNNFVSLDKEFYTKQYHKYFKIQRFKNEHLNITYQDGYVKLIKSLIEIKRYNEQFGIILLGGTLNIGSSSENSDHAISFSFCNNYDKTYIIYLCDPNIDNCKIIYDTRTNCFTSEGDIQDIQNKLSFENEVKQEYLNKGIYFLDGTLLFKNSNFIPQIYNDRKIKKEKKENLELNMQDVAIYQFYNNYKNSLLQLQVSDDEHQFKFLADTYDETMPDIYKKMYKLMIYKNYRKDILQIIELTYNETESNKDIDYNKIVVFYNNSRIISLIMNLKMNLIKNSDFPIFFGGLLETFTVENKSNIFYIYFTFIKK